MSRSQKLALEIASSTIVLQATITQPMLPFRTEEAIDPLTVVDDRSAIDQFVKTIEELNIVIKRHTVPPQVNPLGNLEVEPSESEELESLLALDGSDGIEDDIGTEMFDTSEVGFSNSPACAATGFSPGINSAAVTDDEVTIQLNNLIFLGYMSAVESYFRCLTRQLIWADDLTAAKVNDLKISFGAARHADPKLLPEVLMEDMTFITLDSVKNLLNAVIGVGVVGVADVIEQYDRICQLRHCIVHRFGRLGSKNASRLGLQTHKDLFERKIKISSSQLVELAFSLLNFVRALNNHIYSNVLERSAKLNPDWQWDEELDMKSFEDIYSVFRKTTSPSESASASLAYQAFKQKCETGSATQTERARKNRLERRGAIGDR